MKSLSCVQLLATPWTAAHQAPLSMGFSRQEYWSGEPLPSPSPVFTIAKIGELNIHTLLSYLHSLFHPSIKVLKTFLQNFIKLTKDDVTYLNDLTQTSTICRQTHPNSNIRPPSFPHPPNS